MRTKLLFLSLLAAGCIRQPEIALEGHFFLSSADEKMAATENPRLIAALTEIVAGIVEKNPQRILLYVHPDKGAIIDAKAFVSYAQVASALNDPKAQLYRVLWDDAYWKETAPQDKIRSYRKVFGSSGKIRVGIFYYSNQECEVRLDFDGRPSMGLMGNPVFRRFADRWYLMNFF